jgi:catechol 2,3-dioxygenase-like lactoylglutathione lyase family enzyme
MKRLFRRTVAKLAAAAIVLAAGMGTSFAGGLPTAVGVDHIGLTVPDLKQGIDFFSNVLGCEHVYTAGPFADPTGDWMKSNLNVDARAATTLAMMRCGPSQNVELFEYTSKDQVKTPPKNSDVGGNRIAFYVKDLPAAVGYLKSVPGVTVLGSPTPVSHQPNGGETFVYFLTPWGQSMELLTYPGGLEYEKTTKARLYSVHD